MKKSGNEYGKRALNSSPYQMMCMQIKIQSSCDASWKTMTPLEKGKHCDSCDKVVYDFTSFTDKQLIDWIGENGSVCGRLHQSQLNRALIDRNAQASNIWITRAMLLLSSLFFTGFSKDVNAKNINSSYQSSSRKTALIPDDKVIVSDSTKLINGIVFSRYEKLPMSGVLVVIEGITSTIYTNDKGEFQLAIPNSYTKKTAQLKFSSIGYDTEFLEVELSKKSDVNVSMSMSEMFLGEMIAYIRPKGLISTIKYYLRKVNPLPLKD